MGRTKSPAPPQIPLASFSARSPSCRPLGNSLRDLCRVVADTSFGPTWVSTQQGTLIRNLTKDELICMQFA